MSIFSREEMVRRHQAFLNGMAEAKVDVAFLHTADNVYYMGGVPLLSEWGRPMWFLTSASGDATLIGAALERETMEDYAWLDDLRTYDDSQNVWQASMALATDFIANKAANPKRIGVEKGLLTVALYERLQSEFPAAELVDISSLLEELRLVKSDEEYKLLKIGAEVANYGARAFMDALVDGVTELEVVAHAVAEMNRELARMYPGGSTSTYAYAQFGRHTLTPHLHATGQKLQRGDVVGLNVFPVIWGYCMELERTLIFGEPSPEKAQILETVTQVHEEALQAFKAGVKASDIDNLTRSRLTEAGYGEYIRHGTGHAHGIMIGAAGREEPGELRFYNDRVVTARQINSIEPAVYHPEHGGFRHSDVVWLSENGPELMTDFPLRIKHPQ